MTALSLRGASGASYGGFIVYDPQTASWNRVPGCYAFLYRPTLISPWQILYIGKCDVFADRMPPCHERWDEAARRGATHIAANRVQDPSIMDFQERDMIAFYKPPMNTHHVTPQLRGGLLSGLR